MDIQKAKVCLTPENEKSITITLFQDDVDQVAEKRKKHQKANAELYEMDAGDDVVPPKPVAHD